MTPATNNLRMPKAAPPPLGMPPATESDPPPDKPKLAPVPSETDAAGAAGQSSGTQNDQTELSRSKPDGDRESTSPSSKSKRKQSKARPSNPFVGDDRVQLGNRVHRSLRDFLNDTSDGLQSTYGYRNHQASGSVFLEALIFEATQRSLDENADVLDQFLAARLAPPPRS